MEKKVILEAEIGEYCIDHCIGVGHCRELGDQCALLDVLINVGDVRVDMSFKNDIFYAECEVRFQKFKADGYTWKEALDRVVYQLQKKYTGTVRVFATKEAKKVKDDYYYRTSPIPGDTYKVLITPSSSLRDRHRSLCD